MESQWLKAQALESVYSVFELINSNEIFRKLFKSSLPHQL